MPSEWDKSIRPYSLITLALLYLYKMLNIISQLRKASEEAKIMEILILDLNMKKVCLVILNTPNLKTKLPLD